MSTPTLAHTRGCLCNACLERDWRARPKRGLRLLLAEPQPEPQPELQELEGGEPPDFPPDQPIPYVVTAQGWRW